MVALQVGGQASFVLFVVLPGVALVSAIALSVYEIYRIGERKLLIVIVILVLMLQHQFLEAFRFVQTGDMAAEGIGEVFETGANLIASGSVYYVLRFARREQRLVADLERSEQQYRSLLEGSPVPVLLHGGDGIRYANDAAVELFDANDRSELTGSALPKFALEETSEQVEKGILTDGGADIVEGQIRTLADQTRYVVMNSAAADYEGDDVRQIVVRDFTERKRREREFEQIFNNVHDIISINHPETGEILRVNDTMCEMLGYSRDEILELGVDGLSTEEFDKADAKDFFDAVTEADEPKQTQWAVETSDGETRWLEVDATEADIGGERRFITTNRDITERKRREREYEQIFDSVSDAITVFHPETAEILDVNATYYELLGYEDLETIQELGIEGLSVTEEGYTDERGQQIIRDVAETGESETVEWRAQRKDGTHLWLEATVTPAEIGGEKRVLSIQRDITERKRREREYEEIFESVNDGIVVWNPETLDLLDANDAYLDMLGYDDIQDLRAQGVDGISVAEEGYTFDRGLEIHQRVSETGEPELVEWKGETRDGEQLWLEVKITPAVIGGEKRTISINRNITERKHREQRLEVFNRVLRHNLRNQLDVIKSHAEPLRNQPAGDHAESIIEAADRLASMGERARRIDRFMSRDRTEMTVDLPALVRETVADMDHSVAVTLDLSGSSPITTDKKVLQAVLDTSISTATEYADSTVAVSVDTVATGLVIEIDDDGLGIPQEEVTPLDIGTETELQHGRGLRLWQLQWGVKKLGGDLSFATDEGATVRITIPDLRADP